jgi:hypothetical protein
VVFVCGIVKFEWLFGRASEFAFAGVLGVLVL